jgi:hypothetical protein
MNSIASKSPSVLSKGLTHPPRQRILGRQGIVFFIFLTMVGATVTNFKAIGANNARAVDPR